MSNKPNHKARRRRAHWQTTRRAVASHVHIPTLLGLTMYEGLWVELYACGEDVLLALPCLPPDEVHPQWVEDAFEVRRAAFIAGQCPECGSGDMETKDDEMGDDVPDNHHRATLLHEDDCSAASEAMTAYCQARGLAS